MGMKKPMSKRFKPLPVTIPAIPECLEDESLENLAAGHLSHLELGKGFYRLADHFLEELVRRTRGDKALRRAIKHPASGELFELVDALAGGKSTIFAPAIARRYKLQPVKPRRKK